MPSLTEIVPFCVRGEYGYAQLARVAAVCRPEPDSRRIDLEVAAQRHSKFKAGLSSGGRDLFFDIVAAGGIKCHESRGQWQTDGEDLRGDH
jgi:hypothetical protein